VDSINATTKRITWANLTSALQTYFSTLYSPIFSTSAQLAGLLSDETGTGGGFVRAVSPTITTPILDVAGTDATGDIYYNGGSGVLTRLPIGPGPSYYLRTSAGGIPEWDNNILSSIVTASTTFKATTSIAADSVTNGAFILNGIPYQFPNQLFTSTSSGLVLVASSTGVLSWGMPLASAIASYSTSSTGFSVSYTGSTTIRHNLGVKPRTIRIKMMGWSINPGPYAYRVQSSGESIISRTNTGTSTITGLVLCTTPVYSNMSSSVMSGGFLPNNALVILYSSGSDSTGCDDGLVYLARFKAIDETTMTITEDVIGGTGGLLSNVFMLFEFIP
jgi:hypothetical protein